MITELVPFADALTNGNPQYCRIYATALNGNTLTITEEDVALGGFNYDARSTSGDVLELGSAIAAQLSLRLKNRASFVSFRWYGAKLLVQVGVEANGTIVYGNFGVFIVDEAEMRYDAWNITALDNMVRFDKLLTTANWNTINNGTQTVGDLIRTASVASGVSVGTLDDLLNNSDYLPDIPIDDMTTWRNILQWCGEFAGVCFYCDGIGRLCCKWYDIGITQTSDITISHDKRFRSNVSSNDVVLTGVIVSVENDGETVDYVYPSLEVDENDRYRIQIEGNPLFNSPNVQTYVGTIGARIKGFTYAPFDAVCVPCFYLSIMDGIFVEENNASGVIPTTITHVAFTLNGNTTVEAIGKSVQSKSYSNGSAFTRQQSVMVNAVKEQMTEYVGARERALTELNTLMANAMGLQATTIDGKWYAYYSPDNTGIDNATIIYTLTTSGLAWTKDWNGGSPTWNYGITADGNAVLNQINVTGISVAEGGSEFETQILPSIWQLLYQGNPLITASGSTGQGILTLDKVQMTGNGYIRMGKARMYGTSAGMDIVIED